MNKFSKLLLTSVLVVIASVLCSVYATNYYVGFSNGSLSNSYPGTNAGLTSALTAAGANDVVYIAKGTYYLDVELTVNEHIIGGCNPGGDGSESERKAIGAAASLTSDMTVLDGNSLRHPLRSEKHRVATVNTGGIIENCLIRNGHARGTTNDSNDLNGHGGGVLLNGGKLYNCIMRGNVAMNVQYQSTNKSSGGGVYITNNGGQVVNCVIAFNMDDKGVGIDGVSGESINNTIAYNTMTPKWINIPGGNFQPYEGSNTTTQLTNRYITLSSFYMAETECTGGQFACFMAAIDLAGSSEPYSLTQADKDAMVVAKAPVPTSYEGYPNITVEQYALLSFNSSGSSSTVGTTMWDIMSNQANNATNLRYGGCLSSDGSVNNRVWFPLADMSVSGTATVGTEARRRDNYPISLVSWYGSLAYSLWLGGCLPTEAQWEYAARRSTSGMNNTLYAGSGVIGDVAWYAENSDLNGGNNSSTRRAHEVAKKASNGIGLYDMSGNLYEWVLDPYGSYIQGGTTAITSGKNLVSGGNGNTGGTSGSRLQNPVALPAASGSARVLRGGYWSNAAASCSLGPRYSNGPYNCSYNIGFRAVCVP
jgi:formylglycine-generating enzyme required for sulfatase activity